MSSKTQALVRSHMPELDSVRGLAILLVLLYHGFAWSFGWRGLSGLSRLFVHATLPGWLGVNLFFVLSGFLITGILVRTKASDHYFNNFYLRRALRILPAYYFVLLILLLVGESSGSFLLASFFYVPNLAPLLHIPVSYGVLWSLGVEEQFYLVWPWVVKRFSSKMLTTVAIAIIVLTPVLRGISFTLGYRNGLSGYTWFVADGLAYGGLLFQLIQGPLQTRDKLTRWALAAIGLSVVMLAFGAPFGILTRNRLLGAALQVTPWNLGFTACLAFVLLIGTSPAKMWANVRPLRFLGDISYGLYLYHLFIFAAYDSIVGAHAPSLVPQGDRFDLMALRFAVVLAGSIGVSLLSRRWLEAPFLRLKSRWTRGSAIPALPVVEAPAHG